MKTRFATLVVIAGCAVGTALSSGATAVAHTTSAPVARVANSCTYGRINGVRKCLRAGEYCSRSARRQYRKYGFSCSKRDDRGDWHLVAI